MGLATAQELKTHGILADWSAGAATLAVPYVGTFAVTLGIVGVPPTLSAPPCYSTCLNWVSQLGIAPVV